MTPKNTMKEERETKCMFCNDGKITRWRFKPSSDYPLAYDLCDKCAKKHQDCYNDMHQATPVDTILSHTTPTTTEGWEKEFDEKFTVIVRYEKWPDEDEPQKLREPVYRFTDFPNTNPKVIKSFISKVESQAFQRGLEKGREEERERILNLVDMGLKEEGISSLTTSHIRLTEASKTMQKQIELLTQEKEGKE